MSIADILALIQTVGLVIGGTFALFQWRLGNRVRQLETTYLYFAEVHSPAAYVERDELRHLRDVPPDEWSEQIYREATRVADFYNRAGYLVELRQVDRAVVLHLYSGLVREMWGLLSEFVVVHRSRTGLGNYGQKFENLAVEATEFRRKMLS